MTDHELAAATAEYLKQNPTATRNKIAGALNTTTPRLKKIEAAGLVKLPPKLSARIGATMGRKRGGWGKGFTLGKRK